MIVYIKPTQWLVGVLLRGESWLRNDLQRGKKLVTTFLVLRLNGQKNKTKRQAGTELCQAQHSLG